MSRRLHGTASPSCLSAQAVADGARGRWLDRASQGGRRREAMPQDAWAATATRAAPQCFSPAAKLDTVLRRH